MARVLLVGYIPELLLEPERVLRTVGYNVTVASSFATASAAIQQSSIDVAVLGFSVPEDERNQMARILKEICPAAKIIMIYFASLKNTELADALMPTSSSADEILRAVNHILNKDHTRRA
jgi:DNA-binding NtrC family response regulator